MTQGYTNERPKRGRKKQFDRENLLREYPNLSELLGPPRTALSKSWVAAFSSEPDAVYAVLADIIKLAHAKPGRVGQRPMPKEEQVDLDALIYGDTTDLPIHKALKKVMTISERQLAREVFMSRTQVQRMMAGEYEPDVEQIRLIAKVVGKPPTYFIEYRISMVIAAIHNAIADNPNIATMLYRKYLTVRDEAS